MYSLLEATSEDTEERVKRRCLRRALPTHAEDFAGDRLVESIFYCCCCNQATKSASVEKSSKASAKSSK